MTIRECLEKAQSNRNPVTVFLYTEEEAESGYVDYIGDEVVILKCVDEDNDRYEAAVKLKKIERMRTWIDG